MARTIVIAFTTDGAGAATETRIGVHGEVLAVGIDGAADTADTMDVTITNDVTGAAIATFTNVAADATRYPKVVPTQPDGTALTTAGPAVCPVLQGRVKVVVAQGGATKSGHVYLTLS